MCNDNGINNRIVIEMIYSEVHTYLIKKIRDVIFGFSGLTYIPPPRRYGTVTFFEKSERPLPPSIT